MWIASLIAKKLDIRQIKGVRFYGYHSYHHKILNPPSATSVLNYAKLSNCVMSRERNVLLFTVCHHGNCPPSDANEIHVYFIGSTIIFFKREKRRSDQCEEACLRK